jgi:RNA polymerase sigma-70 factor, ECF subfamily
MSLSESHLIDLIRRAREDRSALGELLQNYRPLLKQIAEYSLNNGLAVRCDASDIIQQTMLEAYRDFNNFKESEVPHFSKWIKTILHHNLLESVRNHVQTDKRSIRREQSLFNMEGTNTFFGIDPASDHSTPSQRIIRGEKELRLATLLQSLPKNQREAVTLRHIEGLPLEQIAKRLDRSLPATAGLIKRGLQALRDKMSEKSWQ